MIQKINKQLIEFKNVNKQLTNYKSKQTANKWQNINKQLNYWTSKWNFAPVCKANNYSFIVIESVAVTAVLKCHGFLYGSVRFDYYSNFRLNDDKQKNSKTLITLQICECAS